MPENISIKHVESSAQSMMQPDLSVLIPYYRDDPSELIESLAVQISGHHNVEICLYDDGSKDTDLETRVSDLVSQSAAIVRLMTASDNRGRSYARNSLRSNARADWVLFLDADMRPVTDHFISDYLVEIKKNEADIIFGGFEVPHTTNDPERELHRAFSETSDCLTLQARQLKGPQYVCSSNLCVRKTVLDAEPFDPEFSGWGWEDSEWAARTAARFKLVHADIPALHLGLESTDTLLSRFKNSGPNYLRFTHKHPELAKSLKLYNVMHTLKRLPGQKLLRPLWKSLVKFNSAPIKVRLAALKLWRASWYAETL